jgi:hypothetical protein
MNKLSNAAALSYAKSCYPEWTTKGAILTDTGVMVVFMEMDNEQISVCRFRPGKGHWLADGGEALDKDFARICWKSYLSDGVRVA